MVYFKILRELKNFWDMTPKKLYICSLYVDCHFVGLISCVPENVCILASSQTDVRYSDDGDIWLMS